MVSITEKKYDIERFFLAQKCAEAIGLTDVPQILLNEIGVCISDLPISTEKNDIRTHYESSLLRMGVVYRYNELANFIDKTGRSWLIPNSKVLLDELKKCGYVVCEEGEYTPKNGSVFGFVYGEKSETENNGYSQQKRVTLPVDLFDKVTEYEENYNSEINTSGLDEETEKYVDEIPMKYDVFSKKLYRPLYLDRSVVLEFADKMGLESKNARKLLAMVYGASPSLTRPSSLVNDLDSFLLNIVYRHPILNEKLYFAHNGFYEYFKETLGLKNIQTQKNVKVVINKIRDMFFPDEDDLLYEDDLLFDSKYDHLLSYFKKNGLKEKDIFSLSDNEIKKILIFLGCSEQDVKVLQGSENDVRIFLNDVINSGTKKQHTK